MNFDELTKIKNEEERVNKLYEIFDEDLRLNQSKASRVEFITAVKYIEKYLEDGSKILDIGAGAGIYSLYFAKEGHKVEALELADNNIKGFEKKITSDLAINLRKGNALDLSGYPDKSFDIVLLMGPLYHLVNRLDQIRALDEAVRVLKDDGLIFTTFISNDMVILTEFCFIPNYFNTDTFDHNSFDVVDFPFVFHTVDEAKNLINDAGLKMVHIVAQDGVSELFEDKINNLSDSEYEVYLKYHFYCAEKPEMLGRSNHLLFVCRK